MKSTHASVDMNAEARAARRRGRERSRSVRAAVTLVLAVLITSLIVAIHWNWGASLGIARFQREPRLFAPPGPPPALAGPPGAAKRGAGRGPRCQLSM